MNQIWSHLTTYNRLQDYNILMLKKDVEIFLAAHFEMKFYF